MKKQFKLYSKGIIITIISIVVLTLLLLLLLLLLLKLGPLCSAFGNNNSYTFPAKVALSFFKTILEFKHNVSDDLEKCDSDINNNNNNNIVDHDSVALVTD